MKNVPKLATSFIERQAFQINNLTSTSHTMTTEQPPFGHPIAPLPWSRVGVFFTLAIVGVAADLLTKQWVFAWRGLPGQLEPWWVLENYVGIETAVNMGALFGMGHGYSWLFAILSVGAAIGILIWLFGFRAATSKWLTVSMGLVTGGILGNLYDRVGIPILPSEIRGGVRDWILLRYGEHTWPNFNIADSLLVTGAIMLAIHSIFLTKPHPSSNSQTEPKVAG